MRIDFESSGGFANLKLAYHADTDTLPPERAEELLKRVKSSGVFNIQQSDVSAEAGTLLRMYFLIASHSLTV